LPAIGIAFSSKNKINPFIIVPPKINLILNVYNNDINHFRPVNILFTILIKTIPYVK